MVRVDFWFGPNICRATSICNDVWASVVFRYLTTKQQVHELRSLNATVSAIETHLREKLAKCYQRRGQYSIGGCDGALVRAVNQTLVEGKWPGPALKWPAKCGLLFLIKSPRVGL